jgi:predicted ABC-type ATPase
MIIDLRGTNGSGKTTIVQNFLQGSTFLGNSHLVDDLFIVGPYIRDDEYLSTGGCDCLSSDDVEGLVRKNYEKYHILLEGADISTTYRRWISLANEVGFYEYVFIFLSTPLDQCIKNRDKRKEKFNRIQDGENHNIKLKYDQCLGLIQRFRKEERQVYVIKNTQGVDFIKQALSNDFRSHVLHLSGGGKRSGSRDVGLYCSINKPEFEGLYFIRDSAKRLDQFNFDFSGKSVIEYGSNVGALSFEILSRGTTLLHGYEYNPFRVLFCNQYCHLNNLNGKFFQFDFNVDILSKKADVIVCCSVDDYIDDLESFYNSLYDNCNETLLLESNIRGKSDDFILNILQRVGFTDIKFLGNGDCGRVPKKRKIYKCEK